MNCFNCKNTKESNISGYKQTNEFIRAKELTPDYEEIEFQEGNNSIAFNYTDFNFTYDNANIKKALNGVYPFNQILTMNSLSERKVLFLLYAKNLSLKRISKLLNCSFYRMKKISKNAHNNFFKNTINFGILQENLKTMRLEDSKW